MTKPSLIIKRSIVIHGHKTSVSLEDEFWKVLKDIAGGLKLTLSDLVGTIDKNRPKNSNLSSALRLSVLGHSRAEIQTLSETLHALLQQKAA